MNPILYFSNLADALLEDDEVLEQLANAENIKDVYAILKANEYVDFDLADYLLLALQANDDIKHYLDPDTGELSEDAMKS